MLEFYMGKKYSSRVENETWLNWLDISGFTYDDHTSFRRFWFGWNYVKM